MDSDTPELPLHGLRVVDLCDGIGDMCGRYLADLGAEVMLVEPPEGCAARRLPPLVDGVSAYFATHSANKTSTVLDADRPGDREAFHQLALQADVVLLGRSPFARTWAREMALNVSPRRPGLVTVALSDFGDSGPYADYVATNRVHMAMAGVLARSGIKDREPLLPPGNLSYESASIQAAWVALLAFWQRLHTGRGGHLDFSVFEATCQMLDPALGVTGSGAGGRGAIKLAHRGRPPEGKVYPFFPCADGYVRVCVLNPRQWAAMSEWLGNDHPYTDPSFGSISKRFQYMREINGLVEKLFARARADELVAEGQRRGIPMAAVASPQDVLHDPHFLARGAFCELPLTQGLAGKAPNGFIKVNGRRVGIRDTAPALGAGPAMFAKSGYARLESAGENAASDRRRPLDGIRVLDLGVIVAGAELGRLFADQGAEVIKVETHAYPDGLRQSLDNAAMTESFAQGSRGKKSLGLNLRSEAGKRIFKALVARSDIVMSNFKPGTMESLGFGYRELKAINPRIIVSESSALGGSGPMSKSMGYGPLVRASSGLTGLWRYPDDESGFADATTIFPDHLAARVSAVAVLALLINRGRSGAGGKVSLAQAETILMCLSAELFQESVQPGSFGPTGNRGRFDAPANIFPCLGNDEWCAIEVRDTAEWQRLCHLIGRNDLAEDSRFQSAAGRLAHCDVIEAALAEWTRMLSPEAVTIALQREAIPAGPMRRVHELPDDAHLTARGFFRINHQPGLADPLLTENGPAGRSHLPDPDVRPAPFLAEHTRELMRSILGMEESQIDALIASGDLEAAAEDSATTWIPAGAEQSGNG